MYVNLICFYFNVKHMEGKKKRWRMSVAVFLFLILCSSCANSPTNWPRVSPWVVLFKETLGVKPARSTALKVPEFTPKLAPFSLKTQRVPERSLSFLTLQACGDLSPRYTAHINTSSTCHHPGLWEDLSQRCVGTRWRFLHILVSLWSDSFRSALISVTRTQLSNY